MLQSCFSEIESTPKISYKDLKRQRIELTAEQIFASAFTADSIAKWRAGRLFKVSDQRASLQYFPLPGRHAELLPGDTILFLGMREVPSILGGNAAELIFRKKNVVEDTLIYRPGRSRSQLMDAGILRLPFVVDLGVVDRVNSLIKGKELYTRTDHWLREDGSDFIGRKFVRVRIANVDALDENYPFLVSFVSMERTGEEGSMPMSYTVKDETPALRGFENLFLMKDPRSQYPQISAPRWELIRSGKLEEGMTTLEASLAIGAPKEVDRRPDQSILYERWSYPGGIYLIFEDGLLVRFNK